MKCIKIIRNSALFSAIMRCKKIQLLLILSMTVVFTVSTQISSSYIQWNTSYTAAQNSARAVGKPLFLFFEGETPNAVTLSLLQNTFSGPDIASVVNQQFIPMRVTNNAQLSATFNVIRYPTVMVVAPDGQRILGSLSGIMSTENVMSLLLRTSTGNSGLSLPQTQQSRILPTNNPVWQNQQPPATPAYSQQPITNTNPNVYTYSAGNFTRISQDQWVHKTPFYSVNYRMISDGKFFYYLESENRDVYVAVPKNPKDSLWIWQNDSWSRLSRISKMADEEKNVIVVDPAR